MTCSYETERIAEDRDRLAHNPEVAGVGTARIGVERWLSVVEPTAGRTARRNTLTSTLTPNWTSWWGPTNVAVVMLRQKQAWAAKDENDGRSVVAAGLG